jgi:hypothetical protein
VQPTTSTWHDQPPLAHLPATPTAAPAPFAPPFPLPHLGPMVQQGLGRHHQGAVAGASRAQRTRQERSTLQRLA